MIYFFLVMVFMFLYIFRKLGKKIKFFESWALAFENLINKIDPPADNHIARIEIIDLAMKNMQAKRTRTLIAIGGMMIGIGAIVFLVSIGYGLQSLVIKRVARLDEMRQTEVLTQTGSNLFINDEVVTTIQSLNHVDLVLPQIAVVAKVNFNNSSTDMAAYGVTKDYLEQSAISPVVGQIFDSNETEVALNTRSTKQVVVNNANEEATASASAGVTTIASTSAKLIVKESDEGNLGEWVEVEGESDPVQTLQVTRAVLDSNIKNLEAVVNRSFLKVLNLDENEAVGQKFKVTFIATGKLLGPDKNRIESMPIEYEIIGVTPDEKTPLFYLPFTHLKSLGLTNYSQLKVVADKEQNLAGLRQKIESQGFVTSSVSDTVLQINNLFGTARTLLAVLGQ